MRASFPAIIFALAMACAQAKGQVKVGKNSTVDFTSVPQGVEILTRRDDYVKGLSPFDRAARLKTDREVSEQEFLEFFSKNVLAWDEEERQLIKTALEGVQAELQSLALPFPKDIHMIKTSGLEEGDAAYTRSNAIVFSQAYLKKPAAILRKILCHELFHVLTRANPLLRDKLYATIGFVKCSEIEFPPDLKARKISNPDAPLNDHCISLQVGEETRWAIPVLLAKSDKYDVAKGGSFFGYIDFQFLIVERDNVTLVAKPVLQKGKPRLAQMADVTGFFGQVGRNTAYIIHPEEILADNFALLISRQEDLRSPEIVEKMRAVLKGQETKSLGAPHTAKKSANKED